MGNETGTNQTLIDKFTLVLLVSIIATSLKTLYVFYLSDVVKTYIPIMSSQNLYFNNICTN